MCYHVLIETGKVMLVSLVQRFINMEIKADEINYEFSSLGVHIANMIQSPYRRYVGAKLIREDCSDLIYDEYFLNNFIVFMIIKTSCKLTIIHFRYYKALMLIWS